MKQSDGDECRLVEDVLREERIKFLCRVEPTVVSETTTVADVVALLRERRGGCVVVVRAEPESRTPAAVPGSDAALESEGEAQPVTGGAVSPAVGVETERRPVTVGIFTERDYLDKLAGLDSEGWLNVKYNAIRQHMTADPRTLSAETPLDQAIHLMTRGGYRHLPIVDDDGGLYGLLSARDIIEYLAEYFPTAVYNLPPAAQHDDVFDTREGG